MSVVLKRAIGIMVIVVVFILAISAVLASPTVYLYNKLDFWCICIPWRTYYFDAIGYGKDYNSLHIFSLSHLDVERLASSINNCNSWNVLPINQEVLQSDIGDERFDSKMKDMLDSQVGYWYIDSTQHDLYVLDIKNNMLFIRRASILQ